MESLKMKTKVMTKTTKDLQEEKRREHKITWKIKIHRYENAKLESQKSVVAL